jgi:hypothetical protein
MAFITAKPDDPLVGAGEDVAVAGAPAVVVETGVVVVEAGVALEAGAAVEVVLEKAVIPGVGSLWVSLVEPDAFR